MRTLEEQEVAGGYPWRMVGRSPKGDPITTLVSIRCKRQERGRSRAESKQARLTPIYQSRVICECRTDFAKLAAGACLGCAGFSAKSLNALRLSP